MASGRDELVRTAQAARTAALSLQSASHNARSAALERIHSALEAAKSTVLEANQRDLQNARSLVEAGKLSPSLVKRLDLAGTDGAKYNNLLNGVIDVSMLDDPLGRVTLANRLDTHLELIRVTCPIGVLLVIFEARPEVVVQISCLAIKSGNAVILKGGKEAAESNAALIQVIRSAIADVQDGDLAISPDAVQLVSTREEVSGLLELDGFIDLVIPRGSNELVRYIQGATRIPVLGHADGICSVYIDEKADLSKAVSVVVDSKTNYPAACNSAETLLVHSSVIDSVFVHVAKALLEKGVELRCDEASYAALAAAHSEAVASGRIVRVAADGSDFRTEFLDLIMAVKVVDSVDAAIAHINAHGSKHTDAVVTQSSEAAERFMALVDSAGVYRNASTRFADGFRYGFGAEVGVSTNKTHARGPVGLEGLVIYKYRLYGSGQGVAPYNSGERPYNRSMIPVEEAQDWIERAMTLANRKKSQSSSHPSLS